MIQKKTLKYLKFYVFVTFLSSLFGYFQFGYYEMTGIIIGSLWNIPGNLSRVGALFWDVNHFGSLIAALLPVFGVLILVEGKLKHKVLNSFVFLTILGNLLLTNSRTAWMIAFGAFIVFLTILLVKKIGLKGIGIVLLILALLSVPLILEYSNKASPFRAGIKQYFHYRMDSYDSHMLLLVGSFQIFEKYPVLGGGYGGFFEHFSKTEIAPTYFGRDPAALNTRVPAHTIWGQVAAETGAIGISVFTLLMGVMLFTLVFITLTEKDKKIYLVTASMAAVLIGWFIAGIFYSYNSEFFYIVIFMFYMYGIGVLGRKFNYKRLLTFFFTNNKALPFILTVIALVLIFWQLGTNHLVPWDEAIYAKISKNMVESGDYVVQTWKSTDPWYEKPSLYMWLASTFMKVFGVGSFAARLPSALFGLLNVIFVYYFAKKYFNKTVGFISGFALLTFVWWLYYARAAMLDVTATFFISSALFVYFMAKQKSSLIKWVFVGLFVGLAVMTKGFIGLLPLPIMILYELYLFGTKEQKLKTGLIVNYLGMLVTLLVVAVPWHYEMYRRFGNQFLLEYFGYHVWDRATMAIEDKGQPFWWYLTVLRVSMRLWFIALLGAFPFTLFVWLKGVKNKLKTKKIGLFAFLIIWSVFVFLFFSIARSKLIWYIMPIYPALAIIVGYFIERVINCFMKRFKKFNNIVFKTLVLYVMVITVLTYLVTVRYFVYNSDEVGPIARLMELKDIKHGTEDTLYLDRIDLPIAFFYTDSPFEVIDFRSDRLDRVPLVDYHQPMFLLTKAGRFSENVVGKNYPPEVIQSDGDYILWFFESEKEVDQDNLDKVKEDLKNLMYVTNKTYGSIYDAPLDPQKKYFELLTKQENLINKINTRSIITPVN
jgi:4-amino-4-deoxy-L-arabinose transferase-like glycosyltransferase